MKIKNLKYIFGSVVLGLPLFFNVVFGSGCTNNATSGEDTEHIYSCDVPNGSPLPYWNSTPLESFSSNAQLFLKMIDIERVPCVAGSEPASENLVRRIQRKMQAVGGNCSSCIDGKLGNITQNNLSNCPARACPDPNMPPRLEGGNLVCNDGYETEDVNGIICCKEVFYEPQIPIISTNPVWEGGVAHVVIQYTDDVNAVNHRDNNANVFHVSVGTIDNLNVNESSMSVTFDVKDIGNNERSLNVSVGEGLIIFEGNIPSLGSSNTFSYEVDCPNPPVTGNGSNDCSMYFNGKSIYDAGAGCCVETGGCQYPKNSDGGCTSPLVIDSAGECCMSCQHPADGSGACQSGYTIQGSCCFADDMCGDDMINDGGQCKACEEGTKPNEPHTRCICNPDLKCCGVQLNNVVPFIGDCIEMNGESNRDNTTNVTSVTAFPILMQGLMKILMSVIMIFSFLMIIVAGLLIVSGAFGGTGFTTGKKIIKNVIISLILLGCSGLILSLINPSFFK